MAIHYNQIIEALSVVHIHLSITWEENKIDLHFCHKYTHSLLYTHILDTTNWISIYTHDTDYIDYTHTCKLLKHSILDIDDSLSLN